MPIRKSWHTRSMMRHMPWLPYHALGIIAQKKSRRVWRGAYTNEIKMSDYFMAVIGLGIVEALVRTWVKVDGKWQYQYRRGNDHGMQWQGHLPNGTTPHPLPPQAATPTPVPHHIPRPPLYATRQGNVLRIKGVGVSPNASDEFLSRFCSNFLASLCTQA